MWVLSEVTLIMAVLLLSPPSLLILLRRRRRRTDRHDSSDVDTGEDDVDHAAKAKHQQL